MSDEEEHEHTWRVYKEIGSSWWRIEEFTKATTAEKAVGAALRAHPGFGRGRYLVIHADEQHMDLIRQGLHLSPDDLNIFNVWVPSLWK